MHMPLETHFNKLKNKHTTILLTCKYYAVAWIQIYHSKHEEH